MHWQAKLVAANENSTAKQLRAGHFAFVSPGQVSTPKGELGSKQGLLVRDPDGHVMQIVEWTKPILDITLPR